MLAPVVGAALSSNIAAKSSPTCVQAPAEGAAPTDSSGYAAQGSKPPQQPQQQQPLPAAVSSNRSRSSSTHGATTPGSKRRQQPSPRRVAAARDYNTFINSPFISEETFETRLASVAAIMPDLGKAGQHAIAWNEWANEVRFP